jgi:hypothetical protein
MQHSYILSHDYANQLSCFHVSNLDKARFERENVGVIKRKGLRRSFPLDTPIRSCPPAIPVHEETEVGVVEKPISAETLDVNGFDLFLAGHEVKGGIGCIEEALPFRGFEGNDFEAAGTTDTESTAEEMNGPRFVG